MSSPSASPKSRRRKCNTPVHTDEKEIDLSQLDDRDANFLLGYDRDLDPDSPLFDEDQPILHAFQQKEEEIERLRNEVDIRIYEKAEIQRQLQLLQQRFDVVTTEQRAQIAVLQDALLAICRVADQAATACQPRPKPVCGRNQIVHRRLQ